MKNVQKLLSRAAIAALIGVSAVAATASTASAYVACNRYGDCWRTGHRYYVPHVSIRFYGDNWNWRRHHYRWHDHDGDDRGYWDRDHWRHY